MGAFAMRFHGWIWRLPVGHGRKTFILALTTRKMRILKHVFSFLGESIKKLIPNGMEV